MLLDRLRKFSTSAPDQPAVVAGDTSLSYAELEQLSSRLAGYLALDGLPDQALVAIYTDRGVHAITALLGVLKAGAAYTFVEEDGVSEEHYRRLAAMQPAVVLCAARHLAPLRQRGVHALDIQAALQGPKAGAQARADGDETAYVLFTSGSTGEPKGVSVSHANLAHYIQGVSRSLDVADGLHYAHVSTLAADLGNTCLLLSLASGGCLHLLGTEVRKDPSALRAYLEERRIDFLKITPSHWRAIFHDEARLPALKYLVFGGEPLAKPLVRRILESARVDRLFNHYGPTETTVGVTVYPLASVDQLDALPGEAVPIGRPFGDTRLCVRDEAGSFASSGRGELYIGGPSVAQGYRGNPQASAQRFVELQSPHGSMRFYRTGDLVNLDADGLTHFLGRVDRQVKINGHRVELEHIENVMRGIDGVDDAAVLVVEVRGRERLVAAIRSPRQDAPDTWLKDRLQDLLPGYMLPALIRRLSEFPRNANGKTQLAELRTALLAELNSGAGADQTQPTERPAADGRHGEIRRVFCKHLRLANARDEESFFELGGDSLDAIQMIAELQEQGHPVTAHGFLKRPSIQGLLDSLATQRHDRAEHPTARKLENLRLFSPAQRELLEQRLAFPDHYNQALLLRSADKIDIALLNAALTRLMARHPSLAMAYAEDAQGPYTSHVVQDGNDILSVSFIPGSSEADIQAHVERIGERIQGSLSLGAGRIFRAHLFKVSAGDDLLLLVAHHLAVDVISWRIISAELTRHYADLHFGSDTLSSNTRHSFWDWVEHLEQAKERLQSAWLSQARAYADSPRGYFSAGNTEGSAASLWLGFSAADSQRLLRGGMPLHQVLLATFAQCLSQQRGSKALLVDVESHGRASLDDSTDASGLVGWHTSTFPLRLDLADLDHDAAVQRVATAFAEVEHLGIGYGLHRPAQQGHYRPCAAICFNYLGDVNFSHDRRFALTPARYAFGQARHPQNNRCHELKLSARVIDGQVLIDLSFPRSVQAAEMHALMLDVGARLSAQGGLDEDAAQLLLEPGTRTGLINYAPRQLLAQTRQQRHRDYRQILLTGASGYIGIHVLKELLFGSTAHLHCLVRRKSGEATFPRLQRLFAWYFPGLDLAGFRERLSIHEGDVGEPCLGLSEAHYQELAGQLDAIYHFAADTRLFGAEEAFARHNLQSVKTCLALATLRRDKDLHYMSTLAVSGINPGQQRLTFAEDSLDIGQEFQNHYEQSKYRAERLVNGFRLQGHNAYIYRSGNVSADSRNARFQINARDNRLVQFLASCAKAGRLPRQLGEPVMLSPVDQVAGGIVALSLDAACEPGTYHVDSPHAIDMNRLFAAMERAGLQFQRDACGDFAELFASLDCSSDPDLQLGRFWASRKSRNVTYCNDRTLHALERLGLGFTPLGDEWLDAFVAALSREQVFALRASDREIEPPRLLQMQA